MGKLLTILGVSEEQQKKLPSDVFKAEKLIDSLQQVYAESPESIKKNQLASAISESVRILMAKVNPYLVDTQKEEKIKKVRFAEQLEGFTEAKEAITNLKVNLLKDEWDIPAKTAYIFELK